jgi:outer membrane protein insertion porin family
MHEVSFNTTIERNSLNDPIYPTAGSEVGLHIKFTPPYSLLSKQEGYDNWPIQRKYKWKEYHQWILDASYFQKLFGDWVVNMRAHGGIVGGYSPKRGVGPFERFSMGGSNLLDLSLLSKELIRLRGYPDEYILPHDTKLGYKGGTIFDKCVLEVRHPLVKSSMIYIYALAFAEAGNTWLNYRDWRPFDLKSSTGVGLRIHSPFGIIGLDWGYGFDQTSVDKVEFQWSLGGGIR